MAVAYDFPEMDIYNIFNIAICEYFSFCVCVGGEGGGVIRVV